MAAASAQHFQYIITSNATIGSNYFTSLIFNHETKHAYISFFKYNGGSFSMRLLDFTDLMIRIEEAFMYAPAFELQTNPTCFDQITLQATSTQPRAKQWRSLIFLRHRTRENFRMARDEFMTVRRALPVLDRLASVLFYVSVGPTAPIMEALAAPRIFTFFLPSGITAYLNFHVNCVGHSPVQFLFGAILWLHDGERYWNVDFNLCSALKSIHFNFEAPKILIQHFETNTGTNISIGDDSSNIVVKLQVGHFCLSLTLARAIVAIINFMDDFIAYLNC